MQTQQDIVLGNTRTCAVTYYTSRVFVITYLVSSLTLVLEKRAFFASLNTINLTVAMIAMGVLTVAVLRNKIRSQGVLTATGLVLAYYCWLLATCLWSVSPSLTLDYLRFDVFNIFSFVIMYLFSINSENDELCTFLRDIVAVSLIVFVTGYAINPHLNRYSFNSAILLSLACPVLLHAVLFKRSAIRYMYVVTLTISFILLMLSLSRTPLGAAVFGCSMLSLLSTSRLRLMVRIATYFSILLATCVAAFMFSDNFRLLSMKSYARITGEDVRYEHLHVPGEGEDRVRSGIYNYANTLIREHWLHGIGYMNFMTYYATYKNRHIRDVTSTGKILTGMSVHNVYQAWILEGGVPLVLIVVCMIGCYIRTVFRRARRATSREERMFFSVLVILMFHLLLIGWYHQIHQSPAFWMILGYGFAFAHKSSMGKTKAQEPVFPASPPS